MYISTVQYVNLYVPYYCLLLACSTILTYCESPLTYKINKLTTIHVHNDM